jgi:hypothetical protein
MVTCAGLIATALASCASTDRDGDWAVIARTLAPSLPPAVRTPCDRPTDVPDRVIPAREATTLWARDRTALVTCEQRRAAAVAAIDAAREAGR